MRESTLNKALQIILEARKRGIILFVDEGKVKYKTSEGAIANQPFLDQVRLYKAEIRQLLENKHTFNNIQIKAEKLSVHYKTQNRSIPLSFSQERLWFIDQLAGSVQYHIPVVLRLKGIDDRVLERALRGLLERHEVLRTVYREQDGIACQELLEAASWQLGRLVLEDDSTNTLVEELVSRPFDLSQDHMLRANLLKLNKEEALLVVTMHHIASDGWSSAILSRELMELYEAEVSGRAPLLQPLALQYADYAIWQREYLSGAVLEQKLLYWKEKLTGVSPLELPADHVRPAVSSGRGAMQTFHIDKGLTQKLQALSQQKEVTLFMTLLSVFKVLLYRYSGQQDICVGSPVANRGQQEIEGLIGFFINTVALRSDLGGNPSFIELLDQVRQTTLSAYAHQDTPFEKVVEAVVDHRDLSRSPLFQVMFVLQNTPEVPVLRLQGGELRLEESKHQTSKFDLTFTVVEEGQTITVAVEYSTDLFEAARIARMFNHYERLLQSVVANPAQRIGELELLNEAEQHQLLAVFNDTAVEYPLDKTVLDLFTEQVLKSPDATAIVYEAKRLSYKELDERSNQVAHYLLKKGVVAETLVPLCMDRSLELIVGMLGILKAAGAYVPIDPSYPPERIAYMLEDTQARWVLTTKTGSERVPGAFEGEVILLDQDEDIYRQLASAVSVSVLPNQLVYLIYTSGSTGRPKGTALHHQGLMNLVHWHLEAYELTAKSRCSAMSGVGFDAFGWEVWPYLSAGSMIYLVSEQQRYDLEYLPQLYAREGITHSFLVTALVSGFTQQTRNKTTTLQYLLTGADRLPPTDIKGLNYRIVNNYGPTENTVVASYYVLTGKEAEQSVPIGKPISNTRVYILDENGRLTPLGVPGELYIAGAQVARGYLNQVELTAEKFVADPFTDEPGARMYKTGDRAQWLPDGNIEFLGRIDDQVKIRGYRIELGEIESVLQESCLVKQSVVVARKEEAGRQQLVGYVVPAQQYNREELLSWVRQRLPEYMVPTLLMELEALPLTANGKVDRRALPEPVFESENEYEAPRTQTEQVLSEIWSELLRVERIGINNNFFELGGDSIITIQVVSRARRRGYILEPKDLFVHQTVAGLSRALEARERAAVKAEQGMLQGSCGLLPIQQWYFKGERNNESHFNQSVQVSLVKGVPLERVHKAVLELQMQHDALRLIYANGKSQYGALYDCVEEISVASREEQLEAAEQAQRSLSIREGRLMRVVLVRTPAQEEHDRLLLVIHHLSVDGVSWRILLEDLEELLSGYAQGRAVKLGAKTSSYREWVESVARYSGTRRLNDQQRYWRQVVSRYQPLRVDNAAGLPAQESMTATITVVLDRERTHQLLQECSRAYHTEVNDLLLTALLQAVEQWQQVSSLVIGLEGHGREDLGERMDTSRTVGWFTSLYPVLLEAAPGANLGATIKGVKEQLRTIPDKGLGYGVLRYIKAVEEWKEENKDPWDIMFNYLGQLDNAVEQKGWLRRGGGPSGTNIDETEVLRYLLSVNSSVQLDQLVLNFTYSRRHYREAGIQELAGLYLTALQEVIDHCRGREAAFTPSDYGLAADVSHEELDAFLNERNSGLDNILNF